MGRPKFWLEGSSYVTKKFRPPEFVWPEDLPAWATGAPAMTMVAWMARGLQHVATDTGAYTACLSTPDVVHLAQSLIDGS